MKARRSTAPTKTSPFHERALQITLRDVKNEDRSGYVHENTGDDDKMTDDLSGFLVENVRFSRKAVGMLSVFAKRSALLLSKDPGIVHRLEREGEFLRC